jgi:hypothetical protein
MAGNRRRLEPPPALVVGPQQSPVVPAQKFSELARLRGKQGDLGAAERQVH